MKKNKKKKINTQSKKTNKLNKNTGWIIFTVTFLFLALVGFTAYVQVHHYEEGILEVYAHQQDGYVQLVVDQINVLEDRTNEEIVTEILSSLDASTYRYWTLDEDKSLVFVKDVLETNKYKSFTSQTYYSAIDVDTFINKLRVNSVIHDVIKSKGDIYVTSGTQFDYNGKTYTLCLMTESRFILDQNKYIGAKIMLSMLGLLLLVVFLVGVMGLVLTTERWYRLYTGERKENIALTGIIEKLDEELNKDRMFNTQESAFLPRSLPVLFERMQKKDAFPMLMLLVKAAKGNEREDFFEKTRLMLDRKTVRAIVDDEYVLLIMLKNKNFSESVIKDLEKVIGKEIKGYKYVDKSEVSIAEAYEKLLEEVK